jgi:predicted metallopeptidase
MCHVRTSLPVYKVLETLTCHRLHDDEAKIIIIDLVHIPLHLSTACHSEQVSDP